MMKAGKDTALKGLIFDYGGTIDTGGDHWGQVLWHAYERCHVAVTQEQFREAYVHAERMLGANPIIQPDYTFHRLLDTKIGIEMQYLVDNGLWHVSHEEMEERHKAVLADLYSLVVRATSHSREVLTRLAERYPMALVSNFYGNISVVLEEFGLDRFFPKIIESAVVGVRKPDPRIFTLGVEALAMKPEEVMVVGDSYRKDIVPATQAGCHTAWIKGEQWADENDDPSVPDLTIGDLEELLPSLMA